MTIVHVSNSYCYIDDLNDYSVICKLNDALSYFVPGYEYSKAYRKGIWDAKSGQLKFWDGKKHLITKNLRFPTGLLYLVEDVLKKSQIEYTTIDNRKEISFGEPIVVKNITPYNYQKIVIEKAIKEMGGVIQVATGGGKSAICCIISGLLNTKTIVYVHTKDLLYQMKDNVERLLGVTCGQIGDGIIDVRKITVATIQTAYNAYGKKYVEHQEDARFKETLDVNKHKREITKAIESANVIFFDECHRLISDSFQFISGKSKSARFRYALSATAFRDDECDILVSAACGKKIANVSASYLIENKFLVKPEIYMYNVTSNRKKYSDYHTAYSEYIVNNTKRNSLICNVVKKAASNKRFVLILIQRLEHGSILYESLKDDMNVIYLKGSDSSFDRRTAIDAMRDGELNCIIASTIFDEGVDIPILDTLVLAGGGKSKVRAMQRVGRVIRRYPKKEKAIVVDFIDNATYLIKHSLARKKMYESERLFDVKVQESK